MGGRLPDFLGLGVQKGGTTSLHCLLEQHPEVFLPPMKEVHYFSLNFASGEAWYRSQFAGAGPRQRCGEITPYYLFHPQAPSRVQALLPQARLIVLLRDPVERALSQYFHSRRHGFEPLELEAALAAESQRLHDADAALQTLDVRHRSHQEHSYLSRSRYEQQLPQWLATFPADQLLILRSEDLFEQPSEIWEKLLHFLELEFCPVPSLQQPANSGRGEAVQVSFDLRARMRAELDGTYRWAADHYGLRWPATVMLPNR